MVKKMVLWILKRVDFKVTLDDDNVNIIVTLYGMEILNKTFDILKDGFGGKKAVEKWTKKDYTLT